MIQPPELQLDLPMKVGNDVLSTTSKVWAILVASYNGDLPAVKQLVAGCPELIYAQYNYAPPIHFAVREGHLELVNYLLDDGAKLMMEKGMNPNTMSWQHVTLLHDMAQKGFMDKAELLIKYGAAIDPVDEQYQSTPLGMAVRSAGAQ